MKRSELNDQIQNAIRQVAVNGRDAARVYHAIVRLDEESRMWRSRAQDAGWCPPASELESCDNG